MTWKIIRVLEGRCLFGMHLHVKERFSVKLLADLVLFTQLSAMCETAAKRIDYQARLQFRFFLNVFNCLLTTNLSRRNNRSRTGPQTLFNFRRNCNRQWISITFHVYSRYLAATRDVHSTATGYKWLIFRFTTMMQRNQSAHTAWLSSEIKMVLIIITLLISQNTSRSCWWSGGER